MRRTRYCCEMFCHSILKACLKWSGVLGWTYNHKDSCRTSGRQTFCIESVMLFRNVCEELFLSPFESFSNDPDAVNMFLRASTTKLSTLDDLCLVLLRVTCFWVSCYRYWTDASMELSCIPPCSGRTSSIYHMSLCDFRGGKMAPRHDSDLTDDYSLSCRYVNTFN